LRSRGHLWAACFQLSLKFHDPILVLLVKTLVLQLFLRFLGQCDDLFSQSSLQGGDLGPHVLDLAIFFIYLLSDFVIRCGARLEIGGTIGHTVLEARIVCLAGPLPRRFAAIIQNVIDLLPLVLHHALLAPQLIGEAHDLLIFVSQELFGFEGIFVVA
jgi:hypothetical protein